MKHIEQLFFHRETGPGFGPVGDDILVEILDSGDIKLTTDPISGVNHMSAEGLLRTIREIAGGLTTQVKRRITAVKHKLQQHTHTKN